MQIYALSKEGLLIPATEAKRQIDYQCLECKKDVRLRKGLHKRAHYFHIDHASPCRLNGKSLTHIALQHHIQELFSKEKVHLETRFDSIDRIADCVHFEKKLIFEIQCSAIDENEVKKRTLDYNSLGFNVIWILHEKEFNKYRLTSTEIFLQNKLFFYTDMNEEAFGNLYSQEFVRQGAFRISRSKKIPVDLLRLNVPEIKTILVRKILFRLSRLFKTIKRHLKGQSRFW